MVSLNDSRYPINRPKRILSLPRLFLPLFFFMAGCSAQPQTHTLNTAPAPVPANAQFLDKCTPLGVMACNLMSAMSGDDAVERRPACMAYRDSNWKLVETCGSLPASHP